MISEPEQPKESSMVGRPGLYALGVYPEMAMPSRLKRRWIPNMLGLLEVPLSLKWNLLTFKDRLDWSPPTWRKKVGQQWD